MGFILYTASIMILLAKCIAWLYEVVKHILVLYMMLWNRAYKKKGFFMCRYLRTEFYNLFKPRVIFPYYEICIELKVTPACRSLKNLTSLNIVYEIRFTSRKQVNGFVLRKSDWSFDLFKQYKQKPMICTYKNMRGNLEW